jgi:Chromo (CHRromatin Organisation MOdifier) domain
VSRCAYTRKQLQLVPDNENPPSDSVIRGRPERYISEKILKQRIRQGKLQYLVKWERYPESGATWEPADKLQEDVPKLVHEYLGTGKA